MIKVTVKRPLFSTEMTFPCKESQLSEWLDELNMDPEHLFPIATITQIEPAELSVLIDYEVSLDELNYLAKRMEGMSHAELSKFLAVVKCMELNMGCRLKHIINLTFNLDHFTVSVDGKLLRADKEAKAVDFYNGITFPKFFCNPNAVATVTVSCLYYEEYIELPCEDMTIRKALYRLGAESIQDCKFEAYPSSNLSDEWQRRIKSVETTKDIFELNNTLKANDAHQIQEESLSMFLTEVKRKLMSHGFDVVKDNDFLTITLAGKAIASVSDTTLINITNDMSDVNYLLIKNIVGDVQNYCSIYDKAPPLIAEGLPEGYRCLAEFNKVVFAAKNMEYGFEFVTWERTFDGKGVTQGNYFYKDFSAAKENFAIRSSLIGVEPFSREQLKQILYCIRFTLENDETVPADAESLKKVVDRLI